MAKVDLKSRAHSLVDDVVCQEVRYWFELSAFEDGSHAIALMRSADPDSPVLGGRYRSKSRMMSEAPEQLLQQGVPPAVVAYVGESLRLLAVYR
jgi:hypothetical protein